MTHHAPEPLLAHIVDYAGLFPPAGLGMGEAVREYAAQRAGPHAWMLGRFVVPVGRLAEFEAAAADLLPRDPAAAWHLSVLASPDVEETVRAVGEFNCRRAEPGAGAAVADVLELKLSTVDDILRVVPKIPGWLVPYVEIPLQDDPAALVQAIARVGGRAKVRTGGVTADAFPTSRALARFILACVSLHVPWKATAGLHHPLRGDYRLTYDAGSPHGTMFGFLNVLAAGLIAGFHANEEEVAALLEERDAAALRVRADGVRWGRFDIRPDDVHHLRPRAMTAFGSCSFREPVDDLRALGLL